MCKGKHGLIIFIALLIILFSLVSCPDIIQHERDMIPLGQGSLSLLLG